MTIGEIIGLIIVGLIVGALGRLIHPGPDPIGILMTIVIGIGAALLVGWAVGGGILGFILAVIVAAVLVALFALFRAPTGDHGACLGPVEQGFALDRLCAI